MQCDVDRRQPLQLLLQGDGGFAADEQLDLVVGDAAADVAPALAEVILAIADDLGGRGRQLVACGCRCGGGGRTLGRSVPLVLRGGHAGRGVRGRAGRHGHEDGRATLACILLLGIDGPVRRMPIPLHIGLPSEIMSPQNTPAAPAVVIGAGLAGLVVALQLAIERPVIVLAKRDLEEGATAWAQGGIVGVLGSDDSVDSHVRDTQDAGAGLVDEHTARFIAEHSAEAIEWLVEAGVPFSPDPDGPLGLHLTREGGHAVRRIAHAADATGKAIHDALLARARQHPNISLREHWMAVDLITSRHLDRDEPRRCYGVYALDMKARRVETLPAAAVVLATGGVGKVYRYTSNPDTATGDGIAMAWRAGSRVANMEFIQFHPTCLYHPQERSFLITEAMRGEGAHLTLPDGTRFMSAHDERGELAPRDIVARAIDFEMKKHGLDHVWLDARHLGEEFLKAHFPTIHARCLSLGIDIARQPIPVVPAAHYTCGGVVTDLEGRTDLPACTRWARPPTPACTAPTGWPATRCWNAWCWARPAPNASCARTR